MRRKKQQFILEVCILLTASFATGYAFYNSYQGWVCWSLAVMTAVLAGIFLYLHREVFQANSQKRANLSSLLLMNEAGEITKNWHIQGETAVVIGKSYQSSSVDIDLSEADYAVLIAKEHAVLNCIDGYWYIEDLGSRNGTGIKSSDSATIHRLSEKPYRLQANDAIYIAKTKLVIQE